MSSMNENDLWLNGVEVRDSCGRRLTARPAKKGATGAEFNQTGHLINRPKLKGI